MSSSGRTQLYNTTGAFTDDFELLGNYTNEPQDSCLINPKTGRSYLVCRLRRTDINPVPLDIYTGKPIYDASWANARCPTDIEPRVIDDSAPSWDD